MPRRDVLVLHPLTTFVSPLFVDYQLPTIASHPDSIEEVIFHPHGDVPYCRRVRYLYCAHAAILAADTRGMYVVGELQLQSCQVVLFIKFVKDFLETDLLCFGERLQVLC